MKKKKKKLAPVFPGLAWHFAFSKLETGITNRVPYTTKTTKAITFIHVYSHYYCSPIWRPSWKEVRKAGSSRSLPWFWHVSTFHLQTREKKLSVLYHTLITANSALLLRQHDEEAKPHSQLSHCIWTNMLVAVPIPAFWNVLCWVATHASNWMFHKPCI